jgi:predicted transcriptional regulator
MTQKLKLSQDTYQSLKVKYRDKTELMFEVLNTCRTKSTSLYDLCKLHGIISTKSKPIVAMLADIGFIEKTEYSVRLNHHRSKRMLLSDCPKTVSKVRYSITAKGWKALRLWKEILALENETNHMLEQPLPLGPEREVIVVVKNRCCCKKQNVTRWNAYGN